jgi:oxygen-independent coproporphyrinogen-3 oxidase
MQTIAIYLHIPWCLERCPYCDFNTVAARSWPESEYAAALESELATRLQESAFRDRPVATVFFGGGTPSLFAPATIARLIRFIAEHAPLATDAEITLETNPGSTNLDRLSEFRGAGVNRLSLGVQTFNEAYLRALGRHHSVEDSRVALSDARRAGFTNLSLDLIHAIPGQSMVELERDLDEALSFGTEHISAYALTFEPGTPLTRDLQRGRIERLSNDAEAEMLTCIRERLPASGLAAYEVSNFARGRFTARHNQAYWRGGPYLGVGAGAHSFTPKSGEEESWGRRWMNRKDATAYRTQATLEGRAEEESEELTRHQAMGETCWLALRETRGLERSFFQKRYGADLAQLYPQIEDLCTAGSLRWEGDFLRLTESGLLLADEIFASFL